MNPATDTPTTIRPGVYRHYKGNEYRVIAIARHSETEEEMVVYRCLYGDHSLWVRPLALFRDTVFVDGREQLRFTPVTATAEDEWR